MELDDERHITPKLDVMESTRRDDLAATGGYGSDRVGIVFEDEAELAARHYEASPDPVGHSVGPKQSSRNRLVVVHRCRPHQLVIGGNLLGHDQSRGFMNDQRCPARSIAPYSR